MIGRRHFLAATLAAPAFAQRRTPPNVILIMPDQWRGMDMGCAGNRQARTPNLDRLASQGVHFTSAVANTPVCTPARGILMTGQYPHQTGTAVNDVPLPDQQETIAEILARRGYYTGFVGKWHLEGGKREPGFVPTGPRRQGFEYWAANICRHTYFNQVYFRDRPDPIPIPQYDTIGWTDLALEFLDNARKRSKPYFLSLWYTTPHNPYLPAPGYENMYSADAIEVRKNWKPGTKQLGEKKDIAGYYSAITCLDDQIARILKTLDENTIVIVTSDHGDMLGSHGTFLKRKPWEESVRVPGIISWPAGMKGGRTSDVPYSHLDIPPTILGLCGAPVPAAMRGFDYSAYLTRGSRRTPEFSRLAIYTATEANEFGPWRGLRTRRHKYARFRDKPWVLYDLERDPYEMDNLVSAASSRKLIEHFDRTIAAHMQDSGDRWDEQKDRPYR